MSLLCVHALRASISSRRSTSQRCVRLAISRFSDTSTKSSQQGDGSLTTNMHQWNWWWFRKDLPPERQIVRLTSPGRLLADASSEAEVVDNIPAGELLEVVGEASAHVEWLPVRAPLEDKLEVMSEKPLEYQDGWLFEPNFELAEHKLGDKVTVRVDATSHPLLDTLKMLPWWKSSDLPSWIVASVSELYNGKIHGVVKQGRFMIQRPTGSMPERLATSASMLLVSRQRARQTTYAGLLGLVLSAAFALALHARQWAKGELYDFGRKSLGNLVGWLTLVIVFTTPLSIAPCYVFVNSPASTCCVVVGINMLLYNDIFGE